MIGIVLGDMSNGEQAISWQTHDVLKTPHFLLLRNYTSPTTIFHLEVDSVTAATSSGLSFVESSWNASLASSSALVRALRDEGAVPVLNGFLKAGQDRERKDDDGSFAGGSDGWKRDETK
ncbi:hypothetical protein VKT23_015608 [Stygiomarasmius scandens]|uniref:Uncharacterized protein n=1 Tax=Marasmiellus scandens TaxID=2682957 RepID=A0ABR1J200_9AGAR